MAKVAFFECSRCGGQVSPLAPVTVCASCGGSLLVRYDASMTRASRDRLAAAPRNLWRYAGVLPEVEPLTLGEGFTPLLRSREFPNVWIKDEGLNPTASFKARGMAVAIAMARSFGIRKVAAPTAHIFMPRDVPPANLVECRTYGARVTLVDGLISDCARLVREGQATEHWFDLSTMKEPFRVEGKKTMGYEIAEQMGWALPDAILFPTGGGVGVIGIWKAFVEMEQMGWLEAQDRRPRMFAVQAAGCAPVVRAWEAGKSECEFWPQARTEAAGLRVPHPYAGHMVLDILRASGGGAMAVNDDEIFSALQHWARVEGVYAAPEGAASLAAYRKLLAQGVLTREQKVVLFNTGSGLKYTDAIALAVRKAEAPPRRSLGGIIQPY